jgi:hypothetical protein
MSRTRKCHKINTKQISMNHEEHEAKKIPDNSSCTSWCKFAFFEFVWVRKVLFSRRKPMENASQREKGCLWRKTNRVQTLPANPLFHATGVVLFCPAGNFP